MRLSDDQERAIEYVAQWHASAPAPLYRGKERNRDVYAGQARDHPVCSVGGYAGTGKTTVLRELALKFPLAVLVTPTHKAAQVLRGKLPGGLAHRVQTFHSLIYLPDPSFTCVSSGGAMQAVDCGCPDPEACGCDRQLTPCDYHRKHKGAADDSLCDPKEELRFLRRNSLTGFHNLIIVDEASMLTDQEVDDLRFFGLPVLLCGDHGQLPPVKAKMNEHMLNPTVMLTVNHRQGEESGIIQAAGKARATGVLGNARYGRSCVSLPAKAEDARRLLERFQPDARESVVLAQYNRTRAALNVMFHEQLHGSASALVTAGERVIALEGQDAQEVDADGKVVNEVMLHNGTLATVSRVLSAGPAYCLVEAGLDFDYRGREGVNVLLRVATGQFGKPDRLGYRLKPPGTSLWDYAYALTVHRAQGSEFSKVIAFQERPGDKRSLYTACTRARDALVVLTF